MLIAALYRSGLDERNITITRLMRHKSKLKAMRNKHLLLMGISSPESNPPGRGATGSASVRGDANRSRSYPQGLVGRSDGRSVTAKARFTETLATAVAVLREAQVELDEKGAYFIPHGRRSHGWPPWRASQRYLLTPHGGRHGLRLGASVGDGLLGECLDPRLDPAEFRCLPHGVGVPLWKPISADRHVTAKNSTTWPIPGRGGAWRISPGRWRQKPWLALWSG